MLTPSQPHSTRPLVASWGTSSDEVHGNGEADGPVAGRHAVDAHHLARHVHERTAGIAWVDRGVGLDEVEAGRSHGQRGALTDDPE